MRPYVLLTVKGSEVKEPSSGTLHQHAAVIYSPGHVFTLQRDGGASEAVGDGDRRHVKFMHSYHSEVGGRGCRFQTLESDTQKSEVRFVQV